MTSCPRGKFWNSAIRPSVCPTAQLLRNAGCLQLSHHGPQKKQTNNTGCTCKSNKDPKCYSYTVQTLLCPAVARSPRLSVPWRSCLGMLAACRLATRDVRTADLSADGRRSAAIFATDELPSAGGISSRRPQGAVPCHYRPDHGKVVA